MKSIPVKHFDIEINRESVISRFSIYVAQSGDLRRNREVLDLVDFEHYSTRNFVNQMVGIVAHFNSDVAVILSGSRVLYEI